MNYEELKADFYKNVQIQGRRQESSDQLMTSAWFAHMGQVVIAGSTRGVFTNGRLTGAPTNWQFPDDTSYTPAMSQSHSAVKNLAGGSIIRSKRGIKCTKAAVDALNWVCVIKDGEHMVCTIEEAFKMGLQEVNLPETPKA